MKIKTLLVSLVGLAAVGMVPSSFAFSFSNPFGTNTYHTAGCRDGGCTYQKCCNPYGERYLGKRCCEFNSVSFFYPHSIVEVARNAGYTVVRDRHGYTVVVTRNCLYRVVAVDNAGNKWVLFYSPTTAKLVGKVAI